MRPEIIKSLYVTGNLILILLSSASYAQEVKDYDGNVYKTITYGKQVWTAKNLNVSHFRNGDPIPEAKTPEEWKNAGAAGNPAWCFYENNPENGLTHGKLYNWFAINDPRGLVPEGWHVSVNNDWSTLIKNLLGINVAGIKLKDTIEWKSKSGGNQIGFSALPSGYRAADGKFKDHGKVSRWWSNSVPVDVIPSDKIFSVEIGDYTTEMKFIPSEKGTGLSVRCKKN
jgi:uncharacterized protein (TIGR02145 family)